MRTVGRNKAKPHCADLPLRENGAIRLTPIAPYGMDP